MAIYKPSLLDKFKDFVNGLKGNWDQYEDHVADFEAHLADITQAHGLGGIPLVSTESKTYYIDAVNGNDNNDGLSSSTAFKTWAKAQTMIPRFVMHHYVIKIIGNLPEIIRFYGRIVALDAGSLIIEGNTTTPGNQQVNGLYIKGNSAGWHNEILFRYLRINGPTIIGGCVGVALDTCEPLNSGSTGVNVSSAIASVMNCNFGTDVVQDAIVAGVSRVYSANNSGNATRYGLLAGTSSVIGKAGTQPTGTTANEYVATGGVIR